MSSSKPRAARRRVSAFIASAAVAVAASQVSLAGTADALQASDAVTTAVTSGPAPVFPRADGVTITQAAKQADADQPESCPTTAPANDVHCGAIAVPITANADSQVTPKAAKANSGEVYTSYGSYFSPNTIRPMYGIPANATSDATVAVINVGSDPLLSARLNHFRQSWNLVHDPATGDTTCTATNGCLTEIPGDPNATALPAENIDWDTEVNLDTQAISTVCPTCNILAVDAADAYSPEIEQAVATALAHGARYISLSLGSDDYGLTEGGSIFQTPGVDFFASSGDDGYRAEWPATAQGVVSVGGTHTTVDADGNVIHTAWDKAGAGCSWGLPANAEAAANAATVVACGTNRASSDISALADPATGLIGYLGDGTDSSLTAFGGTSLASPLIAAMYALAGNTTDPEVIYANAAADPAAFDDVTTTTLDAPDGVTGPGVEKCPTGAAGIVCTPAVGWDGPTGLGVPTGLAALTVGGIDPYDPPTTGGTDTGSTTGTTDGYGDTGGTDTTPPTDGGTDTGTGTGDTTPPTDGGTDTGTGTGDTTPPTDGGTHTGTGTGDTTPPTDGGTDTGSTDGGDDSTPPIDGGSTGGTQTGAGDSDSTGGSTGGGTGGHAGAPTGGGNTTSGPTTGGSTGGSDRGGKTTPAPLPIDVKGGNPTVSGAPKAGRTVKAKVPTFTDKSGKPVAAAKVTIVWYVNGHRVKTGRSLHLLKKWAGKKVTYTVTASATGYAAKTVHAKAVKVTR